VDLLGFFGVVVRREPLPPWADGEHERCDHCLSWFPLGTLATFDYGTGESGRLCIECTASVVIAAEDLAAPVPL